MAHVLVVGGTGTLKDVSLFLSQHDNTVSVIARDAGRLTALVEESEGQLGQVNPIIVDYNQTEKLRALVYDAVAVFGPVILVVNWMQTTAFEGVGALSEVINRTSPICRYFQVLSTGNEAHYPNDHFSDNPFSESHRILYRTIMLGVQMESNGMIRSLTHPEICNGIVDSIRNDRRNAVIGITDPLGGRSQSA